MTTGAPVRVRDITDRIRFTDQIYGLGTRASPVLTFARGNRQKDSYTKTAISKLDWRNDYVAQYIPFSTPSPSQPHLVGRLVSLVSVYPKEGRTRDFVDMSGPVDWDIDRWPDAIMMREAFWFVEAPILRDILPHDQFLAITSNSRNRLGEPSEALYEAVKDMEVAPVLDLYRSPAALAYLRDVVEPQPSMQVVANRRTERAGYVYALALPEHPGLLKIGSAFDPHLRALNLSTATPNDFAVVDAVLFEDCRTAERAIHGVLASSRHRPDREWFRCDADEFRAVAFRIPGCVADGGA